MAAVFLLQDWLSLSGPASGEIVQSEPGWLDLAGFTHVAFYLTVKAVSVANLSLEYQSAPSKAADLFAAMASWTLTTTARRVTIVRCSTATEPLARWVRWRLNDTGGSAWSVTFRIYAAAVATGRSRSVAAAAAGASAASGLWEAGATAAATPAGVLGGEAASLAGGIIVAGHPGTEELVMPVSRGSARGAPLRR
ncbi:MAG: hypothetical protein HY744_11325 [Deltaproteobacteria bacterium]|nr:hypothetical protein [Deltaproteobacteria bacterium]